MTMREKILLGTAAAVYTVFLCWNVILAPSLKEQKEARQKLWELEAKNRQMQQVEERERAKVSLHRELDPEEADRLIQEMAADTGMDVVRVNVGEAQEMEGEGERKLQMLPVEAELKGPDLESAARMAEGFQELEEAVLIERIKADTQPDGVYLEMELGLYDIQEADR